MEFSTRYDLLRTVITRYDGYYHLSAVKASLLLTTNVILLAALVSEESSLTTVLTEGGVPGILLIAAATLSLVSIVYAVLVIASYLQSGRYSQGQSSVILSSRVASTPLDEYLARVTGIDETTLIDDLARVAHALASGLARKFRRINVSLFAFLGAIMIVVAAYLLSWPSG